MSLASMTFSENLNLLIRLFIFDLLIAFAVAKLEINIEGKNGWAENLPTWRLQNKWTKLLWGEKPYTGYHFWLNFTMLLCLHFPFFVFPLWNLSLELQLLGMFLVAVILEDIFWFTLNPHYGLSKFNKTHAHWHDSWIGPIPTLYFKVLIPALALIAASFYLYFLLKLPTI